MRVLKLQHDHFFVLIHLNDILFMLNKMVKKISLEQSYPEKQLSNYAQWEPEGCP